MRDLGPAILGSLFLHILVIGLVGFTWSSEPELVRPPKIPPHVQAVVMEKPKAAPAAQAKPRPAPKPQPKPKPKPRPAPKPEPKPAPKPAPKPPAKPEPAKKPPAIEQPSMAELLAEEELLMEKAQETPPEKPVEQPSQGGVDEAEMASYEQAILSAINNRWIIPSSLQSHDGLRTEVQIRTVPGGEVISVTVTQSSGYPVLDDSAVNAVQRASPLPVPTGAAYERFRTFRMGLTPDFR